MADDLSSLLSPIRERRALVAAANLKADAFGDVYAAMVQLAREDSALLLAAVEAALELAGEYSAGPYAGDLIDRWHAGNAFREAITTGLAGTPENDSSPAAPVKEDREP